MHLEPKANFFPISQRLQTRLDVIVGAVPKFWENCPHYLLFTRHGVSHSWRVYQNLTQLIRGFPVSLRLSDDEMLIVSAATWLYDIGMQCPNPIAVLEFEAKLGTALTQDQLATIRNYKHKLTHQMILESISGRQPTLDFGLSRDDDYTQLIAEVCRWISNEPLEKVPETLPAYGVPTRTSLLVALLRLADQLYIDRQRLDIAILRAWKLSPREKLRWWLYLYTKILPIDKGQIGFFYSLPVSLIEHTGKVRALLETEFDYIRNPIIRYLWDEYAISLSPNDQPRLEDSPLQPNPPIDAELVRILSHEVTSIEAFHDRGFPKRTVRQKTGFRIFLNYAPDDVLLVKDLYQKLLVEGFRPWMDTDLLPGEKREISIRRAIRNSDFILICLSHRSIGKRGRLQKEIRLALDICQEMLDEDIYLIPVRLEECDLPENLRNFEKVDLFASDGWARLVKAIRKGMEFRISSEYLKR